jgi:hypothetical protein
VLVPIVRNKDDVFQRGRSVTTDWRRPIEEKRGRLMLALGR